MAKAKFIVYEVSKRVAMVDGRLLDPGYKGNGDIPGESHRVKLMPEFCFKDPSTGIPRVSPSAEDSFIEIELSVAVREGAEPFKLDQKYYIDFTPVKE